MTVRTGSDDPIDAVDAGNPMDAAEPIDPVDPIDPLHALLTSIDALQATIERTPPDEGVTLVDAMGGAARWSLPVHDHGLVALVDVMPSRTPTASSSA